MNYRSYCDSKISFTSIIISILVILNCFGAYLGTVFSVPSFVFTLIPFSLIFLQFCFKHKKIDKRGMLYLIFYVFLSVLRIFMNGLGNQELHNFLYLIVFLFSMSTFTKKDFKGLKLGLMISALIMILDLMIKLPNILSINYRVNNVLLLTIADKATYTFVFSLLLSVLLFDICFFDTKSGKKSFLLFEILILLISFYIIFNFVQSKITILSIAVELLIIVFMKKNKIKWLGLYLVFAILIVVFIFANINKMPDYFVLFINRYTGLFSEYSATLPNVYLSTYESRNSIYEFTFKVVLNHILFGVGFGNYSEYVFPVFGVVQAESGILGLLVEGGILNFCLHYGLVITLLYKGFQIYKVNHDYDLCRLLNVVLIFVFVCIGNEFINTTYWICLALLCGDTMMRGKKQI